MYTSSRKGHFAISSPMMHTIRLDAHGALEISFFASCKLEGYPR